MERMSFQVKPDPDLSHEGYIYVIDDVNYTKDEVIDMYGAHYGAENIEYNDLDGEIEVVTWKMPEHEFDAIGFCADAFKMPRECFTLVCDGEDTIDIQAEPDTSNNDNEGPQGDGEGLAENPTDNPPF